jgi:signal transduction histidine kinase
VPRTGLWLRVFVGLLLAVIPPLLILVGTLLLTRALLDGADPDVVAVLVIIAAIVWAAILAIVYTRTLADDIRSLVALARRGQAPEELEAGSPYAQLAAALEDRNRQVASLARQSGLVQIDDDPRRVAGDLVATVRDVLEDATWRLAILATDSTERLVPGIYRAAGETPASEPIGELEQWASVTGSELPARRIEGPWGGFTVVDVSARQGLSAILYAPWEGRSDPSPANLDLLRLVGQHAATALEHSLLYAKVRSQADELVRLSAIQSDFLRGVTHDLQTPLTSIGALATELRANERVPAEARMDLDTIAHQADRLRRMVAQLLVASRLEAGALAARQEVFAVTPLVERTWAALRANRPFELMIEGRPHLAVGDPDRLEQVLWAVLDNAVKYSPPGTPIEVTIAPRQRVLDVSVHDHGTGMDSETLERAFEQFFRSADARRRAPDGSGVGLYAARGLMEAMGGWMTASSTLGSGTVMTIGVPAEPSDGALE